MSDRKIRKQVISAKFSHYTGGLRARAQHRDKLVSTNRVKVHQRRKREGRVVFSWIDLPREPLLRLLEGQGHLDVEQLDRYDDDFVREAFQIFLEDLLVYGPRETEPSPTRKRSK